MHRYLNFLNKLTHNIALVAASLCAHSINVTYGTMSHLSTRWSKATVMRLENRMPAIVFNLYTTNQALFAHLIYNVTPSFCFTIQRGAILMPNLKLRIPE